LVFYNHPKPWLVLSLQAVDVLFILIVFSQLLTLDLLAVSPGVQEISGLALFDRSSGKSHELVSLPRVHVESPSVAATQP
jgi:hypothetical protein